MFDEKKKVILRVDFRVVSLATLFDMWIFAPIINATEKNMNREKKS